MRSFFFAVFLFTLFASCARTTTKPIINGTGTIAGSDSTCGGWLILDQDHILLDPLNLSSFTVTLKAGQPVSFSYFKAVGININICLYGPPITLVTIEDR